MTTGVLELGTGEAGILRPRMPELDSVRGIAILMVLFYHAFYWSVNTTQFPYAERLFLTLMWTGRMGVNLFFVLSGFLITGLLVDSRSRADYYRRFYLRRALRILPAYMVVLLVLFAIGTSFKFIGLSFLYLSNLTPLFGVALAYPVLWSLAVEEHFYFAWPMVVRKLTNRGILVCSALIVLASPFIRLASFYIAARKGWVSYKVFDYTWNSADGLACGAVLAVWLRHYRPERKTVVWAAAGLFVAAVAIQLLGLPFGILTKHVALGAALQVVPWHLAFVAFLAMALVAGSKWGEGVRFRYLEFFGGISYGLYLYHLLVLDGIAWLVNREVTPRLRMDPFLELILQFLAFGAIAVGFAHVSRKYFEEWFLKFKSRFS